MHQYLKWDQKTIADFSEKNIGALYNQGYLFGRTGRGEMYQTRSLRIDLSKFKPSSENRRILRKTENLKIAALPIPYPDYNWSVAKLAKDFYDTKFGNKTFTANKVKELLTDATKSNFSTLLIYTLDSQTVGYAICYQNPDFLHYCYPFYNLKIDAPNLGLGMMLKAIMLAQEENKKYIYLGSYSRPTDTYKLQFEGLEWFNGKTWQTDQTDLKNL